MKNIFKSVGIFLLLYVIQFESMIVCMFISMISEKKQNINYNEYSKALSQEITSSDFLSKVMLLYTIITIIICSIWFYKRFFTSKFTNIKKYVTHITSIFTYKHGTFVPLICILIISMQYATIHILSLSETILPGWTDSYKQLLEAANLNGSPSLIMLLYACILAPICEELVFRGMILHYCKLSNKFWIANFIQAFLFGLMHGNLVQFSYTFILGLILGMIVEETNTLLSVFLIHIGFNALGLFGADLIIMPASNMLCIIITSVSVLILGWVTNKIKNFYK